MKDLIKDIANKIYNVGIHETQLVEPTRYRLQEYYNDKKQKKDNVSWIVKDHFKNSSSSSFPSVDNHLWSTIRRTNSSSLPKVITRVGTKEVQEADQQTFQRYSHHSKRIRRCNTLLWSSSGISAAKQLGFFNQEDFGTIKPQKVEESIDHISKNTNSGYPIYGRKNDPKCKKDAKNWVKELLNDPTIYKLYKNPLLRIPQVIFHRFQIKLSEDQKTLSHSVRVVWGLSQRIITLEDMFFHKLIERAKNSNIHGREAYCSTGMNNSNISSKLVKRLRRRVGTEVNRSLYSMDYSKYDQTIPLFAIDLFFMIWKEHLDLEVNEDKIYELLRFYTKYSPYIHNNKFSIQERGISSGTLITNVFDTWWNLTLWITSKNILDNFVNAAHRSLELNKDLLNLVNSNGIYIPITKFKDIALCGDDVLIYCSNIIIQIHKKLCESLEITINIFLETRDEYQPTYFLGRYWDNKSRPFQTEQYMASHITVRERFYKKSELNFDISEKLDLYRILSICSPLSNGVDYMDRTFYDWKPYVDFKSNRENFFYLKEWPNDQYVELPFAKHKNWKVL